METTSDRPKNQILVNQVAYQSCRRTTEQITTIKLLAEIAFTCSGCIIYMSLLDMSKAFDLVNRKALFEILEAILEENELHIFRILTNQPAIKDKIRETIDDSF